MRRAASILYLCLIATAACAQVPASNHVFLVLEENHDYSSIVGNTADMPYLNGLIAQYGLATHYYADTHPSIGNYFMLTTGQILTNDDSQTPFSFPVSADNIVRQILTAGKTWKSYAESLPAVGYTGGDVYPYIAHHNPFAYFTDVQFSSGEVLNLVPFSQFISDLVNDQLPNYSFIVPNRLDDAHDGTLQQADQWLQANIGPLLNSAVFQQDGILVILFDESAADDTNGGGRVEWVVVGPNVHPAYQSTSTYRHESTLRLTCDALGILFSSCPGAGASAPTMGEFFGATATTSIVSGAGSTAGEGCSKYTCP